MGQRKGGSHSSEEVRMNEIQLFDSSSLLLAPPPEAAAE